MVRSRGLAARACRAWTTSTRRPSSASSSPTRRTPGKPVLLLLQNAPHCSYEMSLAATLACAVCDVVVALSENGASPSLWVGTSLGSVLVINLQLPSDHERRKEPVVVSPTGERTPSIQHLLTSSVLIPPASLASRQHHLPPANITCLPSASLASRQHHLPPSQHPQGFLRASTGLPTSITCLPPASTGLPTCITCLPASIHRPSRQHPQPSNSARPLSRDLVNFVYNTLVCCMHMICHRLCNIDFRYDFPPDLGNSLHVVHGLQRQSDEQFSDGGKSGQAIGLACSGAQEDGRCLSQ